MPHLWTIGDICAVKGQKFTRKAATKNDGVITGISIDSREIKAAIYLLRCPELFLTAIIGAAQSAGQVPQ